MAVATLEEQTDTACDEQQNADKKPKKQVSFPDQVVLSVVPEDLMYKYEDEYDANEDNFRYIGIKEYERAARKIQKFLKAHMLALIMHCDAAAAVFDDLESVLDLQKIELDNVIEEKEDRMAEIRAEWEDELEKLESEEIQKLQMDKSIRYEAMDEIIALQQAFLKEKKSHSKWQTKLDHQVKKAEELQHLAKLKRRQWKHVRLLREVQDEVEDLQSQLDKVEANVATVTNHNTKLLATIEQVAEKLNSKGVNYFELMQPDKKKPNKKQDGFVDAPSTPPKIGKRPGGTPVATPVASPVSEDPVPRNGAPVVEDPVPKKKQPQRKSVKKTANAPSPLSVVDETQELKQSHLTKRNSKDSVEDPVEDTDTLKAAKARLKAKAESREENPAASGAGQNGRKKTPGRRPTFLLNKIKGYVTRTPSMETSKAKQTLHDQKQRFAHVTEFSKKERPERPVHLLSKDSGRLQLL